MYTINGETGLDIRVDCTYIDFGENVVVINVTAFGCRPGAPLLLSFSREITSDARTKKGTDARKVFGLSIDRARVGDDYVTATTQIMIIASSSVHGVALRSTNRRLSLSSRAYVRVSIEKQRRARWYISNHSTDQKLLSN